MENNEFTSSRFLLWDRPNAYPKYDLITRESSKQVFDLGVDLEDYNGSVYILPQHIVEMARTLGMATADEVTMYQETIKELRRQINKLPNAQDVLKDGIDRAVARFYADIATVESDVVVGSEESDEATSETNGSIVL